jgi:peptidoglycan/LPS O-acetylase OafA/YrhL
MQVGLRGEYASFLKTRKFGSLDGLRATAILAVIWHHAGSAVPGWQITTRGFLGVDLFFIISGFLIVTLLLREQRQTRTISLRNFYIRRFLRIFPPYYLMLLVVGTVAFLKPDGNTSEAVKRDLPYALLYVSNLVPMYSQLSISWSLSVEEQFYMVIPAIVKCSRRALPIFLLLAYVLVCLPPFRVLPALRFPAFFMQTTFGPVLLGAMLAYFLNDPLSFSWVSRLLGWRLASIIAFGLVLAVANYSPADMSGWPRIGEHWAMLALVASCVVRETNILEPLLSLWPMRRIGVVSYGMYLYHLLVMHFVLKGLSMIDLSLGFVAFVGTAVATWGLAELSYRFFESRILALKARYGLQGVVAASAASSSSLTSSLQHTAGAISRRGDRDASPPDSKALLPRL